MPQDDWPELYTGPWIVTGNVAKVKAVHALERRLSIGDAKSILDIGVVGPQPLEFWHPLLDRYPTQFHLHGVDVWGVDWARQVVQQGGWEKQVTLQQGDGYTLNQLFPPETFDVVVATQVLEHIARLSPFLQQVVNVMRHGAEGFFVFDSAHYQSRFDLRYPVRLAKNLLKKGLSLLGYERHYDLPWLDHEVVSHCEQAGLKVIECRYYNLHPIKNMHNHLIPHEQKNAFAKLWFDLEEFINADPVVARKMRSLFMGVYVHVAKL
jgi:2-polyprenyl-3-methyl-5-hydroxy-6-metoxy-1,4-benzoquinol methylase